MSSNERRRQPGIPPDQANHNLEHIDRPQDIDPTQPPTRQAGEDDFAAEAHGFTGYENVGEATEGYHGNKEDREKMAEKHRNP